MKSPDLFLDSPGASVSLDWPKDYEQQFWREYPHKVDKVAAVRALNKARKKGIAWRVIIEGVQRYKIYLAGPGWRPAPKNPATFVNGECWNNDFQNIDGAKNATPSQRARAFAQRAADLEQERDGGSGAPTPLAIARHSG